MKSQYAGLCVKCSKTWNVGDEIFLSKSSDGQSWVKCIDKVCFESQGGKVSEGKKPFVSTKFPISDAPKIYNMAESMLDSFLEKRRKIILEDNPGQDEAPKMYHALPFADQAIFIESMFKTLSTNYKP